MYLRVTPCDANKSIRAAAKLAKRSRLRLVIATAFVFPVAFARAELSAMPDAQAPQNGGEATGGKTNGTPASSKRKAKGKTPSADSASAPNAQTPQAPGAAPSSEPSGNAASSQGNASSQDKASPSAKASPSDKSAAAPSKPAPPQRFDIDDFAVTGADLLPQIELEEAIYPYLGPKRTADDVEKARAALEKTYHDKGYQTVSVSVPQQNVQGKVVTLKVTEMKVGRLRVKGSRYYDIGKIKEQAPSLKEGKVPNFDAVTKDIVALNQLPDRRVTPALRAGATPGTVDVDLNVEDKLPLHGSLELNNRRSPSTTPLRLLTSIHYDNLWQLGHSVNFSYQVSPMKPSEVEVFSGSYLARFPELENVSFLAYGLTTNSGVATVGGTNVVGKGEVIGARAVITLPSIDKLFHTISFGADYKRFGQLITISGDGFSSPIRYVPLVASYGATYQGDDFVTQLNASVTYNIRGFSSNALDFDNKRYLASANFTHFNLDVSHTHELPEGFQLYARMLGQLSDGPMVSSEQFSVGGLDTVRGYLESETLGDNGIAGGIEIRTPNLGENLEKALKDSGSETSPPFASTFVNDWRFFAYGDAGSTRILRPAPEQQTHFQLASLGGGVRFKAMDYFNGMAVVSVPMLTQFYTRAGDPRVIFRVWGEF